MGSQANPLPSRRSDWPADAKEDFEERAAILEFDAGLPRVDANKQAEVMVRAQWAPQKGDR